MLLRVQRVRAQNALKTSFIADALAMPAHWYYQVLDIERAFAGGIKGFEAAPEYHPSSIMSLHSKSSGGRHRASNSSGPQIVGDVILKGRSQYWNKPNVHYHQGMKAGENTLNAHCARVLMRFLASTGGRYNNLGFVSDYIAFMTADPPRHNDTYAESYHRGFFANYAQGRSPLKCAAKTHDTASVGALVMLAPIVFTMQLAGAALSDIQIACREHLALTHPDESLMQVSDRYVKLLNALVLDPDDATIAALLIEAGGGKKALDFNKVLTQKIPDRQVIGQILSPACYISDAWPAVLYLAYKYRNDPWQALLVNTNLGGDNVHRGMVLGTILGLMHSDVSNKHFMNLSDHTAIGPEIDAMLSAVHPAV